MKWNILSKEHENNKTPEQITAALLKNRGMITTSQIDQFLHPSLNQLEREFFNHNQLTKAIDRINKAIRHQEQIIVYSDYDVDGITGTAILWETLDRLGATAMPFVPDRFRHGYGLSQKGITTILQEYPQTKLIMTVDNGITAAEEVSYLKQKGIDVIITDHHTIPASKPSPYALIHTTELSGSGVAYVFSRELLKHISQSASKSGQGTSPDHLSLAAIGTIADLVPLVGPNRVIAQFGLEELSRTKRIGLAALLEICGLKNQKLDTYHVGFMIAPRINAAGRLAQGIEALQLLCTKSRKRALSLAQRLNDLNQERQVTMGSAFEHAQSAVSGEHKLLFVSHESYHEGIIGLVAGNLAEKFYRPAIVVSIGKKLSKASARSIRGLNIIETIRLASDLLVDVGGHPMAAGFSVKTEHLVQLEEELHRLFNDHVPDSLLEKVLTADMELSPTHVSQKLYASISRLKPYGVGNHEPVFVSYEVIVSDVRLIGREGSHLKLRIKNGKGSFEAIGFNMGHYYEQLSLKKSVGIAYSIMENEWNGVKSLQLKLRDIKIL
ncbi:MAG: single-stranded-DNA-specific exonuclease RecJ [Candidatus Roizmanbacteria bacterium]|nr:single-stranded-DNA-specific exonuclease RecJ [Candidatus Roizmanbacteria bacterium]